MYTVIARKYRPQTFEEVVNQEHIKQTLHNAITGNRIAHGYIFSGQRGTGKTTMARLLAKALNCVTGPTTEPCGQCASCGEIAAGNSVDVIEIDAASNRGIDEVRALRENVRYAPARDRFKIYIVDEAHQITRDAWNALLKTLEEPPGNVLFVFCTTASHSIPATIVSRCQSFRFHNLGFEQTVAQLRHICAQEGIEATDEALAVITASAEGSLRDALSALDQAIACCGRTLDGAAVRNLLGVVSAEVLDQVVGAVLSASSDAMLQVVDRLVREGHDLRNFARELVRHMRNLLVLKTAGSASGLVEASAEDRERLAAMTDNFSEDDLTRLLQLSLTLYSDLHHSAAPRFHTELGLLKLVHASRLVPLEELLSQGAPGPGPGSPGGSGGRGPAGGRGPSPGSGPSPFQSDLTRKRSLSAPATPSSSPASASSLPSTVSDTQPGRTPERPPAVPSAAPASAASSAARPPATPPPPVETQAVPRLRPETTVPPAGGVGEPDNALSATLIARLESASKSMLALNLELAHTWRVGEDEVAACFAPGSGIQHLVSRDDELLVRRLCTEILDRPVAFRIVIEAPGKEASAAVHAAAPRPQPARPNAVHSVEDDPVVREYQRLFHANIVRVQDLRK